MQASQATNETRLPRAVLKRSAAIEARIKARTESEAVPADPDAPPAPPSAQTATPVDPNPAPPAPSAPPPDPRASDPAYWEQRFKVTQGVLRAEREERTAEVHTFNQRLTELQDQIRVLQASTPEPEPDLAQFLSPEQIEQLGEDDARTIVATAMKAAQATVRATLDAELKPLKDARKADIDRDSKDRQARFKDELSELVPDFAEIDKSEGWLNWLQQYVDVEGIGMVQRQTLLNTNVQGMDAKKTATMFRAYAKSTALPVPPIAPNGSGAAPADPLPQPTNGKALLGLTKAEINDFYKRSALGRVKDAERVEFEARRKLPRR